MDQVNDVTALTMGTLTNQEVLVNELQAYNFLWGNKALHGSELQP